MSVAAREGQSIHRRQAIGILPDPTAPSWRCHPACRLAPGRQRATDRGQAPSCACPTSAAAAVDCACLPPPTGNLDRSIADERKPAVCQSTNLRYAHNSAPDEIFRPVSSPASRILSSSPSRKHIHKPADMVIPAPDPRARIGGSFETAELTTHRTTSRLRTPRASRPCSMYERFPMQAGHWPRDS